MSPTLNPFLHNPELPGEAFSLNGTRPDAILLFHGFTGTSFEVRRLGRVLNNAGFTTAGPLLPGHGTTPAELNRVRWRDWTECAETEYQALARNHPRVFVGGESMGALLALDLAERHPEIAGVMAYAPGLILPLTFLQHVQLRLIAPFVASLDKEDLADDKSSQGYKVNPLKGVLQLIRLQGVVRRRLGDIHQPILIVQGREDKTVNPHGAEVIFESVSSSLKTLNWMEKSGHCVLLDQEAHLVTHDTMDFLFKVIAQQPDNLPA